MLPALSDPELIAVAMRLEAAYWVRQNWRRPRPRYRGPCGERSRVVRAGGETTVALVDAAGRTIARYQLRGEKLRRYGPM